MAGEGERRQIIYDATFHGPRCREASAMLLALGEHARNREPSPTSTCSSWHQRSGRRQIWCVETSANRMTGIPHCKQRRKRNGPDVIDRTILPLFQDEM